LPVLEPSQPPNNTPTKPTPSPSKDDKPKTDPTPRPMPSEIPAYSTPTPTPSRRPPKTISGGVLNGKATNLVRPIYPPVARAVRASGAVSVQVLVDESGNVVSASAVSGHPLLRPAAVSAARASRFQPTMLSGQPVKVSGVIVYNFLAP
jgi:TonB family protein